jgi:hypothetical protein
MKKNLKKINTKQMIKIGVGMLFGTVLMYVFLVNTATFNTAKAQSVTEKIGFLQSEISDLELSYIEKTNNISINDAASFGLIPNKKESKKVLVVRDNATKLTLNIE